MKNASILLSILLWVAVIHAQIMVEVITDSIGDSTQTQSVLHNYLGDYSDGPISEERLTAAIRYLSQEPIIDSFSIDSSATPYQLYARNSFIIRDITIHHEFPVMESDLLKALTIHSGSYYSVETLENQVQYFLAKIGEHGYLVETGAKISTETDSLKDSLTPVNTLGLSAQTFVNDTTDSTYLSLSVVVDSFVDEGVVDIDFYVHRSSRIRVELLEFKGNRKFTNFWTGLIFGGWRYRVGKSAVRSRFVHEDLSDDVSNLNKHYYKRDFAEAEVTDSLVIDTLAKRAYLTISIDEGPMYKIKPRNMYPLRRGMVKRTLDFRERGNNDDYMLRRKIKELEKYYQSRGFADATVTWSDSLRERRQYTQRVISVVVDTGSREQIKAITFEGNESFSDKMLNKVIQSEVKRTIRRSGRGSFVESVYQNDIQRLENFYYNQGYLTVKIAGATTISSDLRYKSIGISIEEGTRSLFDGWGFEGIGDSVIALVEPDLTLIAGAPYSPVALQDDLLTIKSILSDQGYPSASIDFEHVLSDDHTKIAVKVMVDLGKRVTIGDLQYVGNFKSKGDHLNKIVKQKPNDPLSLTKLYKGIRRLRDIDVLTSVNYSIPTIHDSLYDTVSIVLSIEEAKPFVFTGRIGYDSYEKFNTKLSLSNRNFLGKSKILTISGWYSSVEYGGDLSYFDPYFFYSDVTFTARLYTMLEEVLDHDRVNTLTFGNSYQFGYDIVENRVMLSLLAAYEVKEMSEGKNYDPNDPALDSSGIDRNYFDIYRNILSVGHNFNVDLRDSFMRPKKGIFNSFSYTFSKGLTLDEDNYVGIDDDFRFYFPLGRKMVFASRVSGNILQGFGTTKKVVSDQLLTIGGVRNVRGYAEDKLFPSTSSKDAAPTFAYATFYGSAELRFELLPSFEVTAFFDVGTLTDQPDLSDVRLPRFSVGGGLLYLTPIGPVGLLYGHRLYAPGDSYAKEAGHGRLHFSIGYTF